MKTTMDRAGRLVIPKEIRLEAKLAPGTPLEVRWREGRIEIEPAPAAVRLQRRGRLLVAVPRKKTPALRAARDGLSGGRTYDVVPSLKSIARRA